MFGELDQSAQVDSGLFWSLIKRRKKSPPVMVENLRYGGTTFQYKNVTNGFERYFYDIFNEANKCNSNHFETEVSKSVERCYYSRNLPKLFKVERKFDAAEILLVTKDLKTGKSPSHDGIMNEHIIYGGQIIVEPLVVLFNSILDHECILDSWRSSYIIPIYKGNGKPKNAYSNIL